MINTSDAIYVMELKVDATAKEALDQINEKQYTLPYFSDSKHIVKLGISFSSRTRTIEDWIVEE
ncbi:MAG: PD-(D/E)XK nuclease domain-containing protein [Bacteroidales bacterium]|nr:PD-(D/E)XK nuclease domain-containing protein [Bacteroidales bacterium]